MIGDETSPGRLDRMLRALPEGAILRGVFISLLVMSLAIVYLDWLEFAESEAETARTERTEPLPLRRPEPGDQVRPYLPKTQPVGPDRGAPTLPGYDGPLDGDAMGEVMAFRDAGGGVASAVGRIGIGTATDLREFLAGREEAGSPIETLFLHSPGGSVDDALAMASDLRTSGISTVVPDDGYCASACPLVFAGGLTRRAGDASWIGLHQVYAVDMPGLEGGDDVDRSISDIQQTIARAQELLVEMGVDPAIWIKALQTPPAELYVLTEDELVASRFVRPFPDGPQFIGPRRPSDFRIEGPALSDADEPPTGTPSAGTPAAGPVPQQPLADEPSAGAGNAA
ncbi:hypothetical protein [Fulvimarina endophytica]|uniref:COG3904 family protein n=1 Tax=Fulvimarina endophytica TaxID=2293836 RepID=UPI0018F79339|nr:hypothetical protein [Fulvimarina endophytica]